MDPHTTHLTRQDGPDQARSPNEPASQARRREIRHGRSPENGTLETGTYSDLDRAARPIDRYGADVIEAQHLTKRYRDKIAVDDLSFTVRPGVVTGFLGPNGAGKSTTMRMTLGLDSPPRAPSPSTGGHSPNTAIPSEKSARCSKPAASIRDAQHATTCSRSPRPPESAAPALSK